MRRRQHKMKGDRIPRVRSSEPLRWRLELRRRRKSLESTPVDAPARSYYRDSNHFWTDALRDPISAYDFADVLAVNVAFAKPAGTGPRLPALRREIFAALQEAADERLPWFINQGDPPIGGQIDVEANCDITFLAPLEAAVWLRQRPGMGTLIPESLRVYLTTAARSISTPAENSSIVGMAELSAYMRRPEIMPLTRPEQWRIAQEHFRPRWILRDSFRRVAAMNPRSAGRIPRRLRGGVS
jgi:hypothetical protein